MLLLVVSAALLGLAFWHDWRAASFASTAAASGTMLLAAVRREDRETRQVRANRDAMAAQAAAEEAIRRVAADAEIEKPRKADGSWDDTETRPPP